MKKAVFIAVTLLSVNAFSQSGIDSVLASVERNNTTLSALRTLVKAEKIGNKTGLLPSNPVVEMNYLWGHPSSTGNRTDLALTQSFDFPTAYAYRNQISDLANQQSELLYQEQVKEILMQTRRICAELTYRNALIIEHSRRLENARQTAELYQKKLEAGETSILEFNKAKVHWLNLLKGTEILGIERAALLAELARLNGGTLIAYSDSAFTAPQLIPDFEQWFSQIERNNPSMQRAQHEVSLSQKQQQLQMAKNLPAFNAGYMSEKVVGQQFQGITFGITVPLWENRNTLAYAKARTQAASDLFADARLQFYNEMKALHRKAVALQRSTVDFRDGLAQYDNSRGLKLALDRGEISLGDYLTGLSLYYESYDQLLEMEFEFNATYQELLKFR